MTERLPPMAYPWSGDFSHRRVLAARDPVAQDQRDNATGMPYCGIAELAAGKEVQEPRRRATYHRKVIMNKTSRDRHVGRTQRRAATSVRPSTGNVFADLGLPDAQGHMAKAELAHHLCGLIAESGLSQAAAERLGVDQPKVSAARNQCSSPAQRRQQHFLRSGAVRSCTPYIPLRAPFRSPSHSV